MRLPELGKGGTTIIRTPSHSRRGSAANNDEAVDLSESRSPSPAPAFRPRTLSGGSTGSSSAINYRRTMHFPGELGDRVRALRPSSTIPDAADDIDFAAIQRGEEIPPVPALMPAASIDEKAAAATPAQESDASAEPDPSESAVSDRESESDAQDITIPVPAVVVEEVDVRTPLPRLDSDETAVPLDPEVSLPSSPVADASLPTSPAADVVISQPHSPPPPSPQRSSSASSKKRQLEVLVLDPISDGAIFRCAHMRFPHDNHMRCRYLRLDAVVHLHSQHH